MRIGIDGRPLQTASRYRGIGSYTQSLIKNLLALDHDNHYVLFGFEGSDFPAFEGGNVEFAPALTELGVDRRWVWELLFLNGILSCYGLDLFHATEPCCIRGPAHYAIVHTVHDLAPLIFGRECFNPFRVDRRVGYRRQLGTIRRADRIIAVSRSTADDIASLLNVPRDRITVSHEGIDESFAPVTGGSIVEACKARYGIRGDYIIFVGNTEWRKNLFCVLRVLPEVRDRCGDVGLLIVSPLPESRRREVRALSGKLGIGESVHIPGYVPLRDMTALMGGARMLAFPSYYEGFGLPVLEAMACGTPVLTSNISSLPEVAGDAALLVDPYSDEEICDGITRILSEEGLRREMREKGLRRAGLFSWKKHAADVLKVYREVAAGREPPVAPPGEAGKR